MGVVGLGLPHPFPCAFKLPLPGTPSRFLTKVELGWAQSLPFSGEIPPFAFVGVLRSKQPNKVEFMTRTMFVNPQMFSNPRRKRGKRKAGRKSHKRSHKRRSHKRRSHRRNAGIAPFIQNPLILSNPRRRTHRRRRSNPMAMPNVSTLLGNIMRTGAGAAMALTVQTVGVSKIENVWARRGVQLAVIALGGALIGSKSPVMGGAFAGAAMLPLAQDVAMNILGLGVGAGVAAVHKEADLEALAADLEDVMDSMEDDDDDADFADEDDSVI